MNLKRNDYKNILNFVIKYSYDYLKMYIPYLVMAILGILFTIGINMHYKATKMDMLFSIIIIVFWIIRKIFQLSMHFNFLKIIRYPKDKMPIMNKIKQSFTIFKKHKEIPACAIGILKIIYTLLWSLLGAIFASICYTTHTTHQLWFIIILLELIPLIKIVYTYTFAQYIYHDGDNAGQIVTVLNSISLSKLLMKGHKIQYMLLQASITVPITIIAGMIGLIDYFINPIFAPILAISAWIGLLLVSAPYLKMLELEFYQKLIQQRAKQGSHLYEEILK